MLNPAATKQFVKLPRADRTTGGVVGVKSIAETIVEKMVIYANMTIESRAFMDYRDGLLKSHRRLLWAMHEGGYDHSKAYVKSAKIVGDCFAAGTMVETPNGIRAIEHLEVGDLVNTSVGPKRVIETYVNPPAPMYDLLLKDGKRLVVTPDQCVKIVIDGKFYWKPVSELTELDQIVTEI